MNKILLAMLTSSLPFFAHTSQWDVPDLGVGDRDLTQSVEHQKLAEGGDFYKPYVVNHTMKPTCFLAVC